MLLLLLLLLHTVVHSAVRLVVLVVRILCHALVSRIRFVLLASKVGRKNSSVAARSAFAPHSIPKILEQIRVALRTQYWPGRAGSN